MKYIVVDGILAVGKTWTLEKLEDYFYDLPVIFEPVEKYRKFEFDNLKFNPLELYYQNPKENAVCTQLHVIKCLEDTILDNFYQYDGSYVVIERFLTSVQPFVKTMLELGFLSEFSANFVLNQLSNAWEKVSEKFEISKIFLLDTKIDTCVKRVQDRENKEEHSFSVEEMEVYLKRLRENYLEYYTKMFSTELVIVKNNSLNKIVEDIENILD